MNLGSPQQATEYINMSELGECLGRSKSTIKRWIKLKGLPHSKRIISKKDKMYRIDVQKFWKWAFGKCFLPFPRSIISSNVLPVTQ